MASFLGPWQSLSAVAGQTAKDPPSLPRESVSDAPVSTPPATSRSRTGPDAAGPGKDLLSSKYRSADRGSVHIEEDYVIQLADGKRLDLAAYFSKLGTRLNVSCDAPSTTCLQSDPITIRIALSSRRSPRRSSEWPCGGVLSRWTTEGLSQLRLWQTQRDTVRVGRAASPLGLCGIQVWKEHGLSCVFRACSDQCRTNHVWLVQEWRQGRLANRI